MHLRSGWWRYRKKHQRARQTGWKDADFPRSSKFSSQDNRRDYQGIAAVRVELPPKPFSWEAKCSWRGEERWASFQLRSCWVKSSTSGSWIQFQFRWRPPKYQLQWQRLPDTPATTLLIFWIWWIRWSQKLTISIWYPWAALCPFI